VDAAFMINRIDDYTGVNSLAIGGSAGDVDLFRKYLAVEMGQASPHSVDGLSGGAQSITNALRNFATDYIGAEQNYKNAIGNLASQSLVPVQGMGGVSGARAGDYSVSPEGIRAANGSNGQGYDSIMASLGATSPSSLGLPTGPGGAGWTGGYQNQAQPAPGTNEVPVETENGGGGIGGISSDPIVQTQMIMKSITNEMWRTTLTNVGVQQAMGNFGKHQALGQMGGDFVRGIVSGLTKGGG
jgi:hypothetical protein